MLFPSMVRTKVWLVCIQLNLLILRPISIFIDFLFQFILSLKTNRSRILVVLQIPVVCVLVCFLNKESITSYQFLFSQWHIFNYSPDSGWLSLHRDQLATSFAALSTIDHFLSLFKWIYYFSEASGLENAYNIY